MKRLSTILTAVVVVGCSQGNKSRVGANAPRNSFENLAPSQGGGNTQPVDIPDEGDETNVSSVDFNFQGLELDFESDSSLELAALDAEASPLLSYDTKDKVTYIHTGTGISWVKNESSTEWILLPKPDYPEESLVKLSFPISNGILWEVHQDALVKHNTANPDVQGLSFSLAKAVDESFVPLYIGEQGFIYFHESKVSHIIGNASGDIFELQWPPNENETETPISAWKVSDTEYYVMTGKSLYKSSFVVTGENATWKWSRAVSLNSQGLVGGASSFSFTITGLPDNPQVDKLRAITVAGLFSGKVDKVEVVKPSPQPAPGVDPSPQPDPTPVKLTWEKDILGIAGEACFVCHRPASDRSWKEALSEESWKQKKPEILSAISGPSPSMPPANGPVMTDIQRKTLIKWLEEQ